MTQESIAVSTTPPLPGLAMVQQVNAALATIATDFAGPDDPGALAGPFMTWADTGNNLLKRRNAAGSAWVQEGVLLRAHAPIIPGGSLPTTDIGPIIVPGVGLMEWSGAAYAAARSYLPGEVIQQVSFTTTGSTRTSTSPGNAQGVTLTVQPKSTNSILVLNCNFYAGIAPSAGNPLGSWRIYETTGTPTPIGTGLRSLYAYASGGSAMGLEAMGHILVPDLANTSLAERRFLLYSWTNQASSAVRTETINYTVTEVSL
ncbi:hypothetical protein [Bordetella bronchiseptica]|uniref:Phage-related putative exported protein n=1 Tax=Bordetella bronchiseptica (strain ATCC BAA-588 / NCTC 13252 / RB50) TaxID=257310 RepID=A0A0H3LKD1_BORBR|nr:hypothetical protein [Bordetella bronchiseptica]KAK69084.1 hypothetical protein AZ22_1652 [Bordetella bronchiseptica 980-2]KDD52269.1 hypothetical protein L533_1801 [Bordetella bronchiseptica OSU553]KCV53129.1 hypothetical protein L491_1749 [Bordetella bronchiseptica 3E44]KCV59677.1 hypothetical protein AZ14_1734 [Bordetella bronchiseptica 980]KDB74252.1 hypothetical protein AZ21_1710 [Bordetella bronchiseptica B20-10725633]